MLPFPPLTLHFQVAFVHLLIHYMFCTDANSHQRSNCQKDFSQSSPVDHLFTGSITSPSHRAPADSIALRAPLQHHHGSIGHDGRRGSFHEGR